MLTKSITSISDAILYDIHIFIRKSSVTTIVRDKLMTLQCKWLCNKNRILFYNQNFIFQPINLFVS